jgi:hypothetical protein
MQNILKIAICKSSRCSSKLIHGTATFFYTTECSPTSIYLAKLDSSSSQKTTNFIFCHKNFTSYKIKRIEGNQLRWPISLIGFDVLMVMTMKSKALSVATPCSLKSADFQRNILTTSSELGCLWTKCYNPEGHTQPPKSCTCELRVKNLYIKTFSVRIWGSYSSDYEQLHLLG